MGDNSPKNKIKLKQHNGNGGGSSLQKLLASQGSSEKKCPHGYKQNSHDCHAAMRRFGGRQCRGCPF